MARPSNQAAYDANPKLCATCGNPIPYKHRKNKFCSQACATAARPPSIAEQLMIAEQNGDTDTVNRICENMAHISTQARKETNAKYYALHGDEIRAKRKAKRAQNPGARNEYFRAYRQEHAAEIAAQRAQKYQEKKQAEDSTATKIRQTCQKCGQWFYEEDDTVKYCPSCREQN